MFPVIATHRAWFVLLWKLFLLGCSMEMTASAALRNMLRSSASTPTHAAVLECTFLCSDGLRLAAQHYCPPVASQANNNTTQHILLLHGWLDNSRSFHTLAPSLYQQNNNQEETSSTTEVLALDFPGHGLSQHKSPDGGAPQVMAELTFYVAEVIAQLQWDTFQLVGHSMGAAISVMYAASFPEQVERLVLLEGGGPLYRKPQDYAKHVRAAIQRRQIGNSQLYPQFRTTDGTGTTTSTTTSTPAAGNAATTRKGPRLYPSLDAAIDTRVKTATLSPGNQYLSREAAREMVERATVESMEGGVQFRHDPRLQWPSMVYSTQAQVEAIQRDVQCPVCLLLAKDGWPFDPERLERTLTLLQPAVYETLDGSHHFHADPDHAEEVARHVRLFLQEGKE